MSQNYVRHINVDGYNGLQPIPGPHLYTVLTKKSGETGKNICAMFQEKK